jgi:hypothetical protein
LNNGILYPALCCSYFYLDVIAPDSQTARRPWRWSVPQGFFQSAAGRFAYE